MSDLMIGCEHEFTVVEVDNHGREYTVCEECDEEVEVEDTRDFEAILGARADRFRPTWAL